MPSNKPRDQLITTVIFGKLIVQRTMEDSFIVISFVVSEKRRGAKNAPHAKISKKYPMQNSVKLLGKFSVSLNFQRKEHGEISLYFAVSAAKILKNSPG